MVNMIGCNNETSNCDLEFKMAAGFSDHIWTINEIVRLLYNRITYEGLDNDESE
jgi:hypothetical protein